MSGSAGPAGASKLKSISEREFEVEVFQSELPVLIYFSSQRAAASARATDAEVESLGADLEGKLKIVKVLIENAPTLARQLRIQQVPMFMVFAGGRIVDGQAGALGKRALRAMVERHLPRAEGALKVDEVVELQKRGAVSVVDTRDAGAFARAHIPGSTNLPAEEIETRLAELFMLGGQPVLYCRSGDKAKELAAKLIGGGTEVSFLEGGFLAWEAEGLKIERS
ncbi:MAG: thioredoxin [Myxococcales bacterium]|nr:thioredoxin [Myxococcales bacterium]MBL0195100.1 thioredoxin [Myxococcales bacterium]HQY61619.1 rhodanese-like domain-containing protein [Polyangiaceae bacterium]